MKMQGRPLAAAFVLVAIAALAPSADAQAPGIKRTLLQRTDIGDNREVSTNNSREQMFTITFTYKGME